MPPTPRCPFCNTQGLERLKIDTFNQYRVIYCGQCGAIYSVTEFPPTPPPPMPVAEPTPPAPAKLPASNHIQQTPPASPLEKQPTPPKPMTKGQIGAMFGVKGAYPAMVMLSPLCPTCNIEMQQQTVPDDYPEAGKVFWKCPNFATCKQWQKED